MEDVHRESLEDEATHATDEARMVLPGVQALLGFQLIAVFNQRFTELGGAAGAGRLSSSPSPPALSCAGRVPSAGRRGCITRRFVDLASALLTLSLVPLTLGIVIDAYLIGWLILRREAPSLWLAGGLFVALIGL
jgi:hypothetical protein